jgi:predicted GNAT family acetyltransferase
MRSVGVPGPVSYVHLEKTYIEKIIEEGNSKPSTGGQQWAAQSGRKIPLISLVVSARIFGNHSSMAELPPAEHILDNPVWHALRGPLSLFARPDKKPDFVRFNPDVNIFSAVDQIHDKMWMRIAEYVGPEGFCGLFRDTISPPPPGWEVHFQDQCWQMLAEKLAEPSKQDVVRLGSKDVSEMLALAELTEPGPFFSRTPELGRFVGIHREGRLLAMAGERFRMPGYVEISAVCTHPDARGKGLAAELTLDVASSIRIGGNKAFLHVLETNDDAIRLYERLGFVVRRKIEVVFAQWHGPNWEPSD